MEEGGGDVRRDGVLAGVVGETEGDVEQAPGIVGVGREGRVRTICFARF